MSIEIVKIGEVGVDAGRLMICDPCYIESQWIKPISSSYPDHGHTVYRHKASNTLWQYTYGEKPQGGVNRLPDSYEKIIPDFGKTANQLIASGEFEATDIDPTPHIPLGEFSYRGITKLSNDLFCQLNYNHGHPGVAVAFSSGLGDGVYEVFAEIVHTEHLGTRVKKVWIELLSDKEAKALLPGKKKNQVKKKGNGKGPRL
jgi:hypothetical protein